MRRAVEQCGGSGAMLRGVTGRALPRPRGLADVPPCSNRGSEAKQWSTFTQRQFEMKLRVQARPVGSSCTLGFKLGFCGFFGGKSWATARRRHEN